MSNINIEQKENGDVIITLSAPKKHRLRPYGARRRQHWARRFLRTCVRQGKRLVRFGKIKRG